MQKVYQQHKNRGGVVVGIALDGDSKDSLKKFQTRNKTSYPIAIDKDNRVFEKFALSIPAVVLVDRNGVIRYMEDGYTPAAFARAKSRFASLVPKPRK